MTSTPAPLPPVSAANVLRVFREGTPDQIAAGREWYSKAQAVARSLDPADVSRGAAVLAVLSPMMNWQTNVRLARQAYTLADEGASLDEITAALGCLKRNAAKAAAIVLGTDPASVVSGEKVTAFWGRIVDAAQGSTGPSSVVVDRHAADIATGMILGDKTRGLLLGRKGGFHSVQMAYSRAASALRRSGEAPGITPAEVQACCWVIWRTLHAHSQGKAAARADALALAA
jgi:hypothetical protein